MKYSKIYYLKNKKRLQKYSKKYYIKNIKKIKIYLKNNKKRIQEYNKKRVPILRERRRILFKNKKYRRARQDAQNAWRWKNIEHVRVQRINYMSKRGKWQAGYFLTLKDWKEIKKLFNYRCIYCLKKKKLTADHYIPLSIGGKHKKENIVPACKSCNCRKNNSLPLNYIWRTCA